MLTNEVSDESALSETESLTSRRPVYPDHSRRISRRELLGWLRHPGAAAAAACWGSAAAIAPARATESSADIDPGSMLPRLVRRITYGFNANQLGLANTLGFQGYLEHHLNHLVIDDSAIIARLAGLTTLTMTYQQMIVQNQPNLVTNELMEAVILRAQLSNRQLFERMVELWTDHFNIRIQDGNQPFLKSIDDRDVIRPNALGTFPALLSASAHSPAMLVYLDNYLSTVGNPNENYARELMELHSMGVTGGYTQQDVQEVARCFTGWTIWGNNQGIIAGTFRFNPLSHDQGQKTVLGNIIPANGGMQDGVIVLNILAQHPSTASFISRKLCDWLLGPASPQALVNSVAAVYQSTGGDIKSMIRAVITPGSLFDAAPKYRRPFHLYAAAMRALPTAITSTSALRTQLSAAGHLPYSWATPDGYPDDFEYWSGLILPRWNFGASLVNGNVTGSVVDAPGFFAGLTTADQMVDRMSQAMFAGEWTAEERNRIRDYLLPNPPSASRQRESLGLAIASPSFQWY